MPLKKEYSKDKAICKVTFILPKEIAEQFEEVALVGDFNNWDPKANLFYCMSRGVHVVSIELEAGKEYQFRYLADGEVWLNEAEADKHVATPYGSENSVIVL
ncbi:isoamylase early set domain-containing protein [Melioribacteraceae bacterium 4301-Me]|uniref:isoamylase early set domain-containing protein n=1 Tax=Pyranulibacter aquaticus TaxID=3163344 RepID=UPI003596C249